LKENTANAVEDKNFDKPHCQKPVWLENT